MRVYFVFVVDKVPELSCTVDCGMIEIAVSMGYTSVDDLIEQKVPVGTVVAENRTAPAEDLAVFVADSH